MQIPSDNRSFLCSTTPPGSRRWPQRLRSADSVVNDREEGHREVSIAKFWISEMASRLVYRCVQLHGGYGYEEYPIFCFARDVCVIPNLRRYNGSHKDDRWRNEGALIRHCSPGNDFHKKSKSLGIKGSKKRFWEMIS